MDNQITEVSRKLSKISEVMADTYHFIMMRAFVEQWQREADAGSEDARAMIDVINTFYRLCVTVQERK